MEFWFPKGMKEGSAEYVRWVQEWQIYAAILANMYPDDGMTAPPSSCLAPKELLALCNAARCAPPGCFVEVGVYHGGSAYQLTRVAMAQKRGIYLYDTFAGLPYADPSIDTLAAGELAYGLSEATVRAALGPYPYIEAGTFPWVHHVPPQPIAFAHIDVDQYQSHIDSCLFLAPLMASKGIMWFDDVPVLESARKAVRDLFPAEAIQVDQASGRWFVEFT
jgi:hypothetical protein